MQVVEQVAAVREAVVEFRRQGRSVGFVPTMGALHAGHRSLMDAARQECESVVASIFVNPTQFAPQEDLQKYPRPREQDLALCAAAGVDAVFYPPAAEMYPSGFATSVQVDGLSTPWEGVIRPTHFRGVATVVTKLFTIVWPDRAYFGQKDYQQLAVIRRMTRDLNLPIEIVSCPTIRDADGLAMSSRNVYLSPTERTAGLSLSRALREGEARLHAGETNPRTLAALMQQILGETSGVQLDYAVVVDPDSLVELDAPQPVMTALVAARVGPTRLIDNAVWRLPH